MKTTWFSHANVSHDDETTEARRGRELCAANLFDIRRRELEKAEG